MSTVGDDHKPNTSHTTVASKTIATTTPHKGVVIDICDSSDEDEQEGYGGGGSSTGAFVMGVRDSYGSGGTSSSARSSGVWDDDPLLAESREIFGGSDDDDDLLQPVSEIMRKVEYSY